MKKTLPISEAKTHLPALVQGVSDRDEEIVITRNGRPAAVLLSIEEYESLWETIDLLSDPKAMAQLKRSEAYFRRGGKGYTPDEVFGRRQ